VLPTASGGFHAGNLSQTTWPALFPG
jgi:hypothetical protein